LLVGLGVIPIAVFGPARTLAYYEEWTQVLLRPGLGAGTDASRARELIEVTATDSQSFQAIFHNSLYPNPATRPHYPSAGIRAAHWLAGALLTLLTLAAARRRRHDPAATVIVFGALVVLMLLLSPVCHLHYFCLSLPLVMGVLAATWEGASAPHLGVGMLLALTANVVANTLPHFAGPRAPLMQLLRDDGLASAAALLLWLVGILILWKRGRPRMAPALDRPWVSGAAA
jgi:hypothetical protein